VEGKYQYRKENLPQNGAEQSSVSKLDTKIGTQKMYISADNGFALRVLISLHLGTPFHTSRLLILKFLS
jgi:hypothetical protein